MSLTDQIERLTNTLNRIKTTAESIKSTPLPEPDYTALVLRTPLAAIIRDIDTSELGLFTLVPDAKDASKKVARAEFHGATPLRKQAPANRSTGEREIPPEKYAEAALKYLDR